MPPRRAWPTGSRRCLCRRPRAAAGTAGAAGAAGTAGAAGARPGIRFGWCRCRGFGRFRTRIGITAGFRGIGFRRVTRGNRFAALGAVLGFRHRFAAAVLEIRGVPAGTFQLEPGGSQHFLECLLAAAGADGKPGVADLLQELLLESTIAATIFINWHGILHRTGDYTGLP